MIRKFLKQNVLSPKGLNWVQHLVSRIGVLKNFPTKRWDKVFLLFLSERICREFVFYMECLIECLLRRPMFFINYWIGFFKKTITVFVIPSKFFISIVFNSSWAIVNPKRNRKQCALFWWGQLVVLTLLAKIFEFWHLDHKVHLESLPPQN